MKCKKCGSQQPPRTDFCGECGFEMMPHCARCKSALGKDVKFCPQCGLSTDGAVSCTGCGEIIPAAAVVCPKCGRRTDGKETCKKCGEVLEDGATFCGVCGFRIGGNTPVSTSQSLGTVKPVSAAVAAQPKAAAVTSGQGEKSATCTKKLADNKAFKITRTWITFGIFALMLMLSFLASVNFGYSYKVDMSDFTDTDMEIKYEITFKSKPFDAFEAIATIGDDPDKVMAEFYEKYAEAISKDLLPTKIEVDFNYFRYQTAQYRLYAQGGMDESTEINTALLYHMVYYAFMPLMLIIFCLVGFIITLVGAIKVTKGKDINSKRNGGWLGLIVAMVIAMLGFAKLGLNTFMFEDSSTDMVPFAKLNGAAAAVLAFAIIGFVAEIVGHYLTTKEKISPLRLVSQITSVALIILFMCGFGQTIFKRKIEGAGTEKWYSMDIFGMFSDFESESDITTFCMADLSMLITMVVFSIITFSLIFKSSAKLKLHVNAILATILFALSLLHILFVSSINSELNKMYGGGIKPFSSTAWPIIMCVASAVIAIQSYICGGVAKSMEKKQKQKEQSATPVFVEQ